MVGDELSCRWHQGDDPFLPALSKDTNQRQAVEADVGWAKIDNLLNAGSSVVKKDLWRRAEALAAEVVGKAAGTKIGSRPGRSITTDYDYDASGRRIKKIAGGVTTYYFYGLTGLMSEFSTDDTISDATQADSDDRIQYRIAEQTGTPVILVAADGTPRENNRVFPFGERWQIPPASGDEQKFTTYQRDGESTQDYAMARYYSYAGGRFMTPDPGHVGASIGDPQSWNAYAYTRNDPINGTDPDGLCAYWLGDNQFREDGGIPCKEFGIINVTADPPPGLLNDIAAAIAAITAASTMPINVDHYLEQGTQQDGGGGGGPVEPGRSVAERSITTITQSEPSPPGSFEFFFGVDGDIVGILGAEGALGVVINFKKFTESGVYGSIGPAAGANVGISANVGFARRGVAGLSGNIDANLGKISPTVSFDPDGFNGVAVGVGPGLGLSVSALNTGKYTLSDFGADMRRGWNWYFGAR